MHLKPIHFLAVPATLALTFNLQAANASLAVGQLPSRDKLDLYVLMGQSNMAGRGEPGVEDKTPHARVLVFTTNQIWQLAVEPITLDPRKFHGVGPGVAFGKAMAEKNPSRVIGLVPCAVGGTLLERWEPGADLYSNAVYRARAAMRYGQVKGFLWHQGESDSTEERSPTYGARLTRMIESIRRDVGVTNAPFVVGELGEFLYTRTNKPNPYARQVNETLAGLPAKVPFTGCASSRGLTHKGDVLHFDAASQREFGSRYAARMQALQSVAWYPRVNPAPCYQVDASWPQRSPAAPWAAVAGLAMDKQDNVWIYTRTDPTVQVYAPDGHLVKTWANKDKRSVAHSVRIDRDGNVWLVDVGLHIARKHTPEGKVLLTLGTEGVSGEDATHFNMPTDVAFGPNGDLYVSDGYGNNRMAQFSQTGKFIRAWGALGVQPGQFSIPHAVVCDRKGRVYVADRNNARIQVFSGKGKLLDVWSNLLVPWGLYLSPQGELWTCGCSPMPWVFDPQYPNAPLSCPPKDQLVMQFDLNGKLRQLWTFPKAEDGQEKPGQLNWLHNVIVDSKGNLYYTDIIGKRVQKFVRQ